MMKYISSNSFFLINEKYLLKDIVFMQTNFFLFDRKYFHYIIFLSNDKI